MGVVARAVEGCRGGSVSGADLWEILTRLEHADIPDIDRETLRPAFAALHGAEAIPLPESTIDLILKLDQQINA